MSRSMRILVLAFLCFDMLVCGLTPALAGTEVGSEKVKVLDPIGPIVSPNLGGQATVFTISSKYNRFGADKGKVLIGDRPCRVLSWSKKSIQAKIVKDLGIGDYDVTIRPAKGSPVIIPFGFQVVRPRIVSTGPIEVLPNSVYTLSAINLPPQKGQVYIYPEKGTAIACPIRQWTPVSVKIKIPAVDPGDYSLFLATVEGDLTVSDLFHVRGDGQTWDYHWHTYYFTTSATGIMYGGKVCRFATRQQDKDGDGIYYDISDDPRDNGNQGRILEPDGSIPKTHTNIMPVVIGERLYLFWTALEGGDIQYAWTDNVAVEKPVWEGFSRIKARDLPSDSRPNVLYDPQTKTTYIYYAATCNGATGDIIVAAGTQMTGWSFNYLLFEEDNTRAKLDCGTSPSVTVNSKGEIMIARVMGEDVHVTKSKDPFKTSRNSCYMITEPDVTCNPWIQALGQGQVGLTFHDGHNHTRVYLYTDEYGTWDEGSKYEGSNSFRSTTLMPVYAEYKPDPNKEALGLELRLWFFFWNDEYAEPVFGREERYLGELRQVEKKTTNWNVLASQLGYTGEEARQVQETITKSCPLVGVVDNPPPCTLNNNQSLMENQSLFTFAQDKKVSNKVEQTWKVGVFVSSGTHAPACADIHAGLQGAFSETTTTSTKIEYDYHPWFKTGMIDAIHAVPTTLARKFQAYRGGVKIESVPPIIVLQVLGASLIGVPVDPPDNELMKKQRHTAGDLTTYQDATATTYPNTSNSGSWSLGKEPTIGLGTSTTSSTTSGYYLSVKAGGNIPTLVSFGYEGSFTWDVTHETTTSDNWVLYQNNAPPTLAGDVTYYKATLVLAHPSKDPAPYWIPDYVKQGKDAAWFVTYIISEIQR